VKGELGITTGMEMVDAVESPTAGAEEQEDTWDKLAYPTPESAERGKTLSLVGNRIKTRKVFGLVEEEGNAWCIWMQQRECTTCPKTE